MNTESKNIKAADLLLIACLGTVMLKLSWVGHIGSDDQSYIIAAKGWIDSFPFIGHDHWSLRHSVVIPISLSFRLMGVTEFSSIFPMMVFYFLLVFSVYLFLACQAGRIAALVVAALIGTCPLVSVQATISGCDVAELFFVFSCVALFYLGIKRRGLGKALLVLSGVFMAFAWFARLTGAGLGLFFAVLFLFNYGKDRKLYLYVLVGVLGMLMIEGIYYWLLAGDPIHRIHSVMQTHKKLHTVMQTYMGGTSHTGPQTGNIIAESLAVGKLIRPFLVLLFNQEFAVLFWLAFPAVLFSLCFRGRFKKDQDLLLLAGLLCVIWFVFISYLAPVRQLPRYYGVAVLASCLVLSILFDNLFNRQRILFFILLTVIIGFNLLGVSVENKNPLFGAKALVKTVEQYKSPIFTDPFTARKASFWLKRMEKEVWIESPHSLKSGDLYFFNPNRIKEGVISKEMFERYTPTKQLEKIQTFSENKRIVGKIAGFFNFGGWIPDWIVKRLERPNEPAYLYRMR